MAEYGSPNLVKRKEKRKPPLIIFGVPFGEISHDVYEMHVRIRPREKKRRQLCRTSTKFVQEHENHCISRGCSFR